MEKDNAFFMRLHAKELQEGELITRIADGKTYKVVYCDTEMLKLMCIEGNRLCVYPTSRFNAEEWHSLAKSV